MHKAAWSWRLTFKQTSSRQPSPLVEKMKISWSLKPSSASIWSSSRMMDECSDGKQCGCHGTAYRVARKLKRGTTRSNCCARVWCDVRITHQDILTLTHGRFYMFSGGKRGNKDPSKQLVRYQDMEAHGRHNDFFGWCVGWWWGCWRV